jgi:hypothetical protein
MSDFMTTMLLIGSETSVMLFIIIGVFIVINFRKKSHDKKRAMVLVHKLKESEVARRSNLELVMQDVYGYKEEELEENVNAIIQTENRLYSKIIKMYLGSDRDAIKTIDNDVKKIIEAYRGLVEESDNGDDEEKVSSALILRNENEALRLAKAQLEVDLAASMETMENMMTEYANMYEGGQKEGDQRVKNEMFKLRQKLEKRVSKDDLDGDIPELGDAIDLESDIK